MVEQETIDYLVKTFRLAVTNLRIYPPSSQLVTATIDTFHKTFSTFGERERPLTFSVLGEKFLINGEEPKNKETIGAAAVISKLFIQKNIQSLTFKKGLKTDELTGFLTALLTKKREEFPVFENISLDQTVYVATVKGEEMVVKISESIHNSGGDMSSLIKSIRESYDIIDTAPDAKTKQQLQQQLAIELAKQDTSILRDIFDRDLPPKIEQSGIKNLLLGTLSKDKIQNIFGDISNWFEEIRKKEGSDFDAVEQLEKLKGFIHTILQAPAAKEFPRQFFEDLVRKGLLSDLPDWVAKETLKPATIFEVERLIEKKPSELLEKSVKESLPLLIEKLCKIDYNELIIKLLEKLLENLKNESAALRLACVQTLSAIYDVLNSNNKHTILHYMELPVIETAKKETSYDIYMFLADILRKRVFQNLVHNNLDPASRIVELIYLHTLEETMPDAKIRDYAKTTLEKLLPEIAAILTEDIKSGNEKKRMDGIHIFEKFGHLSIDPLIKLIKESDDIRTRKSAVLILKNMGSPAKKRFAEELNLGLTRDEIRHVLDALGDLGDEDMINRLNTLLKYPDPAVKRDILRFLATLNSNQSKILLIDSLKDNDFQVAGEAARILAQIECKEAVPAMIQLLNSGKTPFSLKEELCIFLGSIKDFRALPILIQKLNKNIFWFTANKNEIERVKMRAAWSLRYFPGKDSEKALENASHSKNISVSMAAKESLAFIMKR